MKASKERNLMSDNTNVEWATTTWNPVTGCSKISPGCQNCYAEKMSKRLAGRFGYPKDDPFKVTFHLDRLEQPQKWRKQRRVFVCSMGDLFHGDVPFSHVDQVFNAAFHAPQHIYIILTKRPLRMQQYFESCRERGIPVLHWERHGLKLWKGVTAENQNRADKRIPILLQIPAKVRFVSVEPMLERIDLECFPETGCPSDHLDRLSWVICGGESGPNRRPAKTDWIRDLKDQCVNAGVPFFLKQMEVNDKLVKMPELDGRIWDQFPV